MLRDFKRIVVIDLIQAVMRKNKNRVVRAIALLLFLASVVGTSPAGAENVGGNQGNGRIHHVLLLSVDGLHRQDQSRWVSIHPNSALAQMTAHGVTYTNATTTTPSDSFPGLLPNRIDNWSLTSLQQRLVKMGGRLINHTRYYWLLLAEGHLTRRLFGAMLGKIAALHSPAG